MNTLQFELSKTKKNFLQSNIRDNGNFSVNFFSFVWDIRMGLGASKHVTLMSANKCVCCYKSYWVIFERDYFSVGRCRWAFRGTYQGNGKHVGNKCVAKVFKVSVYSLKCLVNK